MGLQRAKFIAVESETNYGVDAFGGSDPTAWLAADEAQILPVDGVLESNDVLAVHSKLGQLHFGDRVSVNITWKLTGKSGAAGTEPADVAIFKAANHLVTVDPGVDVRLRPVTGARMTLTPSMTLVIIEIDSETGEVYEHKVTGIRGNIEFSYEAGGKLMATFTGEGLYVPFPTFAAAGTEPSLPSEYSGNKLGMKAVGQTLQIDSQPYPIVSWSLATGWEIKADEVANATGLVDFIELQRPSERPNGSLSLRDRSATLKTIIPLIQNAAEFAQNHTFTDGTDTIEVSQPNCQFGSYGRSDDRYDIPYGCNGGFGGGDTGENDYEFIYT